MTRYYESDMLLLDDGKQYGFYIVDAVQGDEHKGKPTMQLKLRVLDNGGEFDGQEIPVRFFDFMINKLCSVLGFEKKTEDGKAFYEVDGRDFVGREFCCVNRHRLFRDTTYNQLDLATFEEYVPF